MIDLTGQNTIVHSYSFDEQTGIATVTLTDSAGEELGEIRVEDKRLRALFEAFASTAKERAPDLTPGLQRAKTTIRKNENKATTEF